MPGYWNTDGLGLLEYLQWCEDLDMVRCEIHITDLRLIVVGWYYGCLRWYVQRLSFSVSKHTHTSR